MRASKVSVLTVSILGLALSTPGFAAQECRKVIGKFHETPIHTFLSPGDPFGRVLTVTVGTLNATGTGILTSVGPGPTPGTLGATTRHLFMVSIEDQLIATGVAVFTPIPGTRNVNDVLTLTITGGTGKFASATGTIVATGIGFNFFPLPPGPSAANQSHFEFTLSGEICGIEK